MAQSEFGSLTHWGLKSRINYTFPPPHLKQKQLNANLDILVLGESDVCVRVYVGGGVGGWLLRRFRALGGVRGIAEIGSIPKYTVSIQMGFIWSLLGTVWLFQQTRGTNITYTHCEGISPESWHVLTWAPKWTLKCTYGMLTCRLKGQSFLVHKSELALSEMSTYCIYS